MHKRGAALFIVLGMVLIITILINVMLNIMLSHSNVTEHQIRRIQAYYAARAGMVYALDMLRRPAGGSGWTAVTCDPATKQGCRLNDPNFSPNITNVVIETVANGALFNNGAPCSPPVGSDVCVRVTATYRNPLP